MERERSMDKKRTDANKEYKSSAFALLFRDKAKLIELYNAIENKQYPADADVRINTLDGALFLSRANDLSFLLEGKLVVLMEHQSTVSQNMPLRMLSYVSRLYEGIVESRSVYARRRAAVPRPEFIVLYNGAEGFPDGRSCGFRTRSRRRTFPAPRSCWS
jgi:hypothetical protein